MRFEATPPDGRVEVQVGASDEGGVRVAVRNTGSGIPADLRERIFQPFFTTKAGGTGRGSPSPARSWTRTGAGSRW